MGKMIIVSAAILGCRCCLFLTQQGVDASLCQPIVIVKKVFKKGKWCVCMHHNFEPLEQSRSRA